MPASPSPPSDNVPARSTREILSELDSLMQRMLSLPVDDSPPPEPAPAPRGVTLTLVDSEATAPAVVAAPFVSATLETVPEVDLPPEEVWTRQLFDLPGDVEAASAAIPDDIDEVVVEPSIALVPEFVREKQPTPPPRRKPVAPIVPLPPRDASWFYGLVLRLDRRLQRMTIPLGVLGRLLRSRVVKGVFGLLGVAMLLAALGWLAKDWLRGYW
jgi:hypothetical protein